MIGLWRNLAKWVISGLAAQKDPEFCGKREPGVAFVDVLLDNFSKHLYSCERWAGISANIIHGRSVIGERGPSNVLSGVSEHCFGASMLDGPSFQKFVDIPPICTGSTPNLCGNC